MSWPSAAGSGSATRRSVTAGTLSACSRATQPASDLPAVVLALGGAPLVGEGLNCEREIVSGCLLHGVPRARRWI